MKQLTIDTNLIRSLNPCKDRFDNYLAYYESFSGTLEQFLSLKHITYDDKVWVASQLISNCQAIAWATACAESVLDVFEREVPIHRQPRQVIEAAKAWVSSFGSPGAKEINTISHAAFDVANNAYISCDVSNAAAHAAFAAAYAIFTAVEAAHNNPLANKTAVYAAARAVRAANNDKQQALNLRLLVDVISTIKS